MTYTKTLGAALLASVALTTNAFACEITFRSSDTHPPRLSDSCCQGMPVH